ncbi:conjugal transfer protein TraI [Amycolatopsis sp. NPDC059090]|uniref:conjugal transfer protein TraI n=1 Tax=unclassified Amycolatopsis TaxID=2618356 RepID=UPI00366F4F55
MSATSVGPDDEGGEVSRGLAALERHLAEVAAEPATAPEPAREENGPEDDEEEVPAARGMTRRVRSRLAEHAEAHQLLELEADEAPFRVTSDRVRRRRRAVAEAGALWRLDRDPQVLAYRDARMRRLLVAVGMAALTLALAWSTAGVQLFAAEGAAAFSPQWWFGWLVEPFCSLALLMVVAGRAYLTTRGRPVADRSVDRTEWVFLGLTLGMNAWPHLPGVAPAFTVSGLVLHLLGPIVAVAIVRAFPRLLAAFNTLGLDPGGPPGATREPVAAAATRADPPRPEPAPVAPKTTARATIPEPKRRTPAQLERAFEAALESRPDGFDPSNAESIRRTLKCGKPQAVELKRRYLDRTRKTD